MNENLNLVEILKDCPKGTKLYSSVFGVVELDHVDIRDNYPIVIRLKYLDVRKCLTTEGKLFTEYEGECILFPSREERDWSKFNPKKDGLVSTCEFKDGDILSYQCAFFKNRTIYIYRYRERFNTGYYVALSGDNDKELMIDNKGVWALNGYNETVRFATEEEKQRLFDAIKEHGYKWNSETKTLEKLVKPKFKVGDIVRHKNFPNVWFTIRNLEEDSYFCGGNLVFLFDDQDEYELVSDKFDPKTLKEFDKVLVKDDGDWIWRVDIISVPADYNDNIPYLIGDNDFDWIIPYNEETKHLVGTHEEAPEYYRYWED